MRARHADDRHHTSAQVVRRARPQCGIGADPLNALLRRAASRARSPLVRKWLLALLDADAAQAGELAGGGGGR
jgi:hypothetical protein